VDPSREKDLKAIAEPRCMKSNTERDDPTLPIPKSESADPTRPKLLKENDEPMCVKSNMEIADPQRA
jgi:hypothetical protein